MQLFKVVLNLKTPKTVFFIFEKSSQFKVFNWMIISEMFL